MFNSNKNSSKIVHPLNPQNCELSKKVEDNLFKPKSNDKDHLTILDDGTDGKDGTVLDKHISTTTTAKSYELQIEEEEEENENNKTNNINNNNNDDDNATRSINNAFNYFLDQDLLLFYLEKFYLIEESVTNISK